MRIILHYFTSAVTDCSSLLRLRSRICCSQTASMPNPNYMDLQTEIEWPMRSTLIDWLLQVHMRYHMLPETLWITINIVDRFLSSRIVSLVKLQLVGITAMFVAAKYEEIMAPSVDEFVYMTENNYSREEILKGERILLQVCEDYHLSHVTSFFGLLTSYLLPSSLGGTTVPGL